MKERKIRMKWLPINETSRFNKAKKAFLGQRGNIRNFAILTPENPMAQATSPEKNRELCKRFEEDLSKGRFVFYKVKGKFAGNIEHSYMVFNVPLDTVKMWCGGDKYNQKSFWMCESKYDEEKRRTGIVSYYWVRKPGKKNAFEMIESSEQWIDTTSEDDNFTQIGRKFKFTIPLEIFKESESRYENARIRLENEDFDFMLDESINNKGFTAWANRARIKNAMGDE